MHLWPRNRFPGINLYIFEGRYIPRNQKEHAWLKQMLKQIVKLDMYKPFMSESIIRTLHMSYGWPAWRLKCWESWRVCLGSIYIFLFLFIKTTIKDDPPKKLLPFLLGMTFFSVVCTCFKSFFWKSVTADLSGSWSGRRASAKAVNQWQLSGNNDKFSREKQCSSSYVTNKEIVSSERIQQFLLAWCMTDLLCWN